MQRVMKARNQYFMETHLAGRQYYDADLVWDELKVGTPLTFEREDDNRNDAAAVQVVYTRKEDGEKFLLGYLPRGENVLVAALLDQGWDNIFDAYIKRINTETHYENQIRLAIRIKKNENQAENRD